MEPEHAISGNFFPPIIQNNTNTNTEQLSEIPSIDDSAGEFLVFIRNFGIEENLSNQGFSPDFIKSTFSYGIERCNKAFVVIAKMEDHLYRLEAGVCKKEGHKGKDKILIKELQTLIHDQKRWCLHLLSKCSKIQLSSQRDQLDLCFSDYLLKNEPDYYRGEGSSMVDIYQSLLETSNPDLFDSSNDRMSSGVIKPDRFSALCEGACIHNKFAYKKCTPSIEELKIEINNTTENTCFDISAIMEITSKNDLLILKEELISCLTNDKVILGGVAVLSELDMGLGRYFLLSSKPSNIELLEGDLLNFRGVIGAYPEPLLLKDGIIRLMPKQQSIASLPLSEVNQNELREASSRIITELPILLEKGSTPLTMHYFKVFELILNDLQLYQFLEKETDPVSGLYSLEIYSTSLSELKKCIMEMSGALSFEVAFQQASRAFEEILNLIHFSNPIEIPKFLENSYLFSSGMAAIDHVFEALLGSDQNKNIAFLDLSYYEITEDPSFKNYLACKCTSNTLNVSDVVENAPLLDIIFLDLYPNSVTSLEVARSPIEDIINRGIEGRTSDKPLTILLDLSTSSIKNEEVEGLLNKYQNEIDDGRLQLVLIHSLAKFAISGFDKYTGGLVQCYSSTTDLSNQLKEASLIDKQSNQAEQLFRLFLTEKQIDLTTVYWEHCIENTNIFYNEVKDLNLIQVALRDENIPMVGLHFKNFLDELKGTGDALVTLVELMQYYIYGLAKQQNLPLFIRPSFGFPHSALIECHTALRIAIGALEEKETIIGYSKLLKNLNKDLSEYLKENHDNTAFLEFLANSDFLKENHVIIIKKLQESNGKFEDLVNILLATYQSI